MADAGFVKVAQVSEINPGEMITVDFPSGDAVLIANVDGVIHACDDICSHAYASLSEGDLNGAEVECPLHGAVFNITTGEALTPPAEAPSRSTRCRSRATTSWWLRRQNKRLRIVRRVAGLRRVHKVDVVPRPVDQPHPAHDVVLRHGSP